MSLEESGKRSQDTNLIKEPFMVSDMIRNFHKECCSTSGVEGMLVGNADLFSYWINALFTTKGLGRGANKHWAHFLRCQEVPASIFM